MARLFGTNGVRGVANDDLTTDLAMRLGRAIGSWLPAGSAVAVARDARSSGPMLEEAAVAGLLSTGVRVVRLGVLPTPALQYHVKTHDDVHAGLMITASHNPPQYNGLKLVAGDGTEASKEEEEAVERLYFEQRFRHPSWEHVHWPTSVSDANERYAAAIFERVDAQAIRRRGPHVVVDAGGGPGALTTPALLERLGCRVTRLLCELDGTFSGRESEPTADHLGQLIEKVRSTGADLGVAHDGDADRAIFVDAQGHWVPGDVSLTLLSKSAVEQAKGGTVSTPVSTSSLLEDVVRQAGGRVEYTAVGSPIVARAMMRSNAVLGGEENGGVIFPELQYCRDGAMTAAKMVELLARTHKPLHELVAALPKYHVSKQKFPVPAAAKEAVLERLKSWVSGSYPGARIDTTDGLKVYTTDGWVLVRPSGTEPIFRVFSESRDASKAAEHAARFVEAGKQVATAR